MSNSIESAYSLAKERYAELGVDTDAVLDRLRSIPISLHCWQGDDVTGFEPAGIALGDGLAVTGKYPGKARTPDELRADLEKAYSLIPGKHRLNLHALYGEFGGEKVDRNQIELKHFQGWIDWAKAQGLGLDFNASFFSHPKSADGFTLANADEAIREFWIEHGIRCRRIGAAMGEELGSPCVMNVWAPDGYKDTPADRKAPRERFVAALDRIFAEKLDRAHILDALECKLFGIGSECYVVGSHEVCMGYAVSRQTLLCLDAGHFHPMEVISDKISSVLQYVPELLLHVSRGVRWDSDHVVTLSDELQAIACELVRGEFLDRTHIGLDYFDASINRVAAWVIGTRNMIKALMIALLEPGVKLKSIEAAGDLTGRLAMMEDLKVMPFGAVWEYYCRQNDVPAGQCWLSQVRQYEQEVQSKR